MKATMKAKRKGLVESMCDMPDHNLSVSGPDSPHCRCISQKRLDQKAAWQSNRYTQQLWVAVQSQAAIVCICMLQLQWELGSPVFGFLLRKYAPHDTYQARPPHFTHHKTTEYLALSSRCPGPSLYSHASDVQPKTEEYRSVIGQTNLAGSRLNRFGSAGCGCGWTAR